MKPLLVYIFLLSLFTHKLLAQCEKEIETNPLNPLNNEFLPPAPLGLQPCGNQTYIEIYKL